MSTSRSSDSSISIIVIAILFVLYVMIAAPISWFTVENNVHIQIVDKYPLARSSTSCSTNDEGHIHCSTYHWTEYYAVGQHDDGTKETFDVAPDWFQNQWFNGLYKYNLVEVGHIYDLKVNGIRDDRMSFIKRNILEIHQIS